MLFHLSVFLSITNCTPPHMAITGLETSTDVPFWQEMWGKGLPLQVSALAVPLALTLNSTPKSVFTLTPWHSTKPNDARSAVWYWRVDRLNWLSVCYCNYWFIVSVSCNTDRQTHSQFYPQHPTAVCYCNYWFIVSVSCNTDRQTHSQFYPQHPTAVCYRNYWFIVSVSCKTDRQTDTQPVLSTTSYCTFLSTQL